jgi:predicted site-specific integrase-resolvase
MKSYSITETARKMKVSARTLQRWIRDGHIPTPTPEIINGQLVKSWTEKEMVLIRGFKTNSYCGKGMDRRKGSRAKQKRVTTAK